LTENKGVMNTGPGTINVIRSAVGDQSRVTNFTATTTSEQALLKSVRERVAAILLSGSTISSCRTPPLIFT
jgi:hypothetical protein